MGVFWRSLLYLTLASISHTSCGRDRPNLIQNYAPPLEKPFGLFRFLNEEKELYEYSEETEYEKIQDGSLYVQIRDLIREKLSINTAGFIVEIQNYQPGVKDPMPLVKSILLLIHKNVEDGSISQDSAMFYAGLVASKLNVFAVREYRLLCVRGYTKSGSREDYDTANQLGIFKILDEPYDIPEIDEIDKQIQEHIINVIEGRTSFKPSNPNWG